MRPSLERREKRPEQNISLRESRFGGTSTTTIFAQYTVPEKMRQHIRANAKRGRPAKRKRALEYEPGEMPSPEKVSKEARVEENDDEDIFEDTFEACL